MRIYPKKLHNLTDLKREKKRLKYSEEQIDIEELFSLDGLLGGGGKATAKKDKKNNTSSSFGTKLDIARMAMDAVLAFRSKGRRYEEKQQTATTEKPKKKILVSAAIELVGGYLKWKVISLGLKGVSHLLKKSKDKKDK